MQEFLIIMDEHLDRNQIFQYIEKSNQFFSKFDITYSSKIYFRNNFALISFDNEPKKNDIIEDEISGKFIACSGSWFFIKGINDKTKKLSLLFKKLIDNTRQEILNIDGAFNFFIFDNDTLKIITDRIGLKPIYCRQTGSVELISSSCLLLASLYPFEIDPLGLKEFLLANKLFGSTTLFKHIKKLDTASIIEYSNKEKKISSYWSIYCGQRIKNLSINEKLEELTAELKTVMRNINSLYNYPFVDITGGWDSRTVIMTMHGIVQHFATVTSGRTETEDDVVIGKQIAEKLGAPHYFNKSFTGSELFTLEKYNEYLKKSIFLTDGGLSAPLYVNTLVSHLKSMSHGADVTLNGSGGELYRSIWSEPASLRNSELSKGKIYLPGVTDYNKKELVRRVIHQASDLSIFTSDFDADIYGHLINLFDNINTPYMPISNIDQITNVYIFYRMANWLSVYSKATGHFLDCFSPLLMSKPLEIAVELSPKDKIFCSFLRKFHESVNPEVAKINTSYGYPSVSLSFANIADFIPAIQKNIKSVKAAFSSKSRQKRPSSDINEVLYLQPEKMKLIGIFNKNKLANFIDKAKHENFEYSLFYKNIFTVEAILNILS